MVLWDRKTLLSVMNGVAIGYLPEVFSGVSIDSRTLVSGDIFFCIKGNHLDGHDFAAHAHAKGAGVLIVEKNRLDEMKKIAAPLIVVSDVLQALERLAQAARERSKARIIAITGSVGKTTTKEALKLALETVGKVHANLASLNNCWGVPLTLARMPMESDYGIFEIGMNHRDEIRPLVKLVRPHVAVITHIAAGHMGFFKNLEEIADAKAEIFEGLDDEGVALLNADSDFFSYLTQKAERCGVKKIVSFGEAHHADYQAKKICFLDDFSRVVMFFWGRELIIEIGASGRHSVHNSLAVVAACDIVGADLERAALALRSFSLPKGRGLCYQLSLPDGGEFHLIDESYNANPASMCAALDLLATGPIGPGGRRIAILGDMLELGIYSEKFHRDLVKPVRACGANPVFLFGKEMKSLAIDLSAGADIEVRYAERVEDIVPPIISEITRGDLVMIKSSHGVRSSHIVTALLDHYKLIK
ncbi:UDP-N-acetylmuramoylalanyl-D-glutamyl-2,6- diaminopimelate--D-alanyl-D-alanine ligase [Bartonella ancashensis]|uniref:UDP-N-acetylmuramoyl-tripeptide--D-alanyl-D-alanine ligase n=2 Tax=Bartonella ancashensis TaxID=1318743 RepID=A0A0M5KZB2_9HYPH|nr:UDP-N-acetylmuramoylalanyl-D-glutamyl-2,6- diaminopimelate--D-alanyl-D-alanine ligase [Bartonella ancashensis]